MNNNGVEVVKQLLKESLTPFFKGRAASKLDGAVDAAAESIAHLVTIRENVKKNKLGVTVMTENASMGPRPPRTL